MRWGTDGNGGGVWLGPRAFLVGLVAVGAFVVLCAAVGVHAQ